MLATALLLLAVGRAGAYEIFLDIDVDGDPRTVNLFSEETTVEVRLILAPTEPGIDGVWNYIQIGGPAIPAQVGPLTRVSRRSTFLIIMPMRWFFEKRVSWAIRKFQ